MTFLGAAVTVQRLTDIQLDLTEILFLRHYVYHENGRKIRRTFDTDLNGQPYERTGIRTGTGSYDVHAGIMCMVDPEDPGNPTRVRMFFSTNGQIAYTTVDGTPIYEAPVGAIFTECEG